MSSHFGGYKSLRSKKLETTIQLEYENNTLASFHLHCFSLCFQHLFRLDSASSPARSAPSKNVKTFYNLSMQSVRIRLPAFVHAYLWLLLSAGSYEQCSWTLFFFRRTRTYLAVVRNAKAMRKQINCHKLHCLVKYQQNVIACNGTDTYIYTNIHADGVYGRCWLSCMAGSCRAALSWSCQSARLYLIAW